MSGPENLRIGELIYQADHKLDSEATYEGTFQDEPVIIKSGTDALAHEAAVLQAVDHEGLPQFKAYVREPQRNLLVMSRLAGVPLAEHIGLDADWNSRPQPLTEALRITDELALCFDALHEAGYLYRDLSLKHVLVTGKSTGLVDLEGCIRTSDVGWVEVDDGPGTWETMAPEEFEAGNHMNVASNIYTLGTVLMQLADGKTPFRASPDQDDTRPTRERVYELHRRLPDIATPYANINSILQTALQPDQTDRYRSVAEFRRDLANP